ncbi:zf-HC2 domain-containing protein [Ascidiaceihabitans sp.]|uniref:anti-sigma factor family protein n=1 Tax=Rhodobacterales TaxID=204455 RepID=UPI003299BA52
MNALIHRTVRRVQGVMFKLPGMITCEVFEDFILAYLEDELPAPQRRVFEMHLKVCRSCRRYLSDYRKTLAATKARADEDQATLENVPEDLIAAVLAARISEDR